METTIPRRAGRRFTTALASIAALGLAVAPMAAAAPGPPDRPPQAGVPGQGNADHAATGNGQAHANSTSNGNGQSNVNNDGAAQPGPSANAAPPAQKRAAKRMAPGPVDGPSASSPDNVSEAPGNRGTVKIHRVTTPDADRRNEPKVCAFRIVGFGFPDDGHLEISIDGHGGPNAGPDSFSTTVTADQLSDEGDFAIAGPTLADGMYKLDLDNTTAPGGSKHKVFKVDCEGSEEGPDDEQPGPDTGGDDNGTEDTGGEVTEGEGTGGDQVLGVTITRPAAPAAQPLVLGAAVAPASAARGAEVADRSALAYTGVELGYFLGMALLLIGAGTVLEIRRRRQLV